MDGPRANVDTHFFWKKNHCFYICSKCSSVPGQRHFRIPTVSSWELRGSWLRSQCLPHGTPKSNASARLQGYIAPSPTGSPPSITPIVRSRSSPTPVTARWWWVGDSAKLATVAMEKYHSRLHAKSRMFSNTCRSSRVISQELNSL